MRAPKVLIEHLGNPVQALELVESICLLSQLRIHNKFIWNYLPEFTIISKLHVLICGALCGGGQ